MQANIFDLNETIGFKPVQGMDGRAVFGAHMQLTYVTFEPGTVVPIHSHPQEQIGLLLRGDATLLLDTGEVQLTELSSYVVPGEVRHGLVVGWEGAVFVEAFHPLRQDYVDAARGKDVVPFQ
ncbi:cupin domain-containing protein [Rhodococcus sp. USK13]|jgi:quercetin dioxygenase-like cupin family protein|uniref:cupin domain-containing protein n=1 Tax=Rhodococcus sp. USK13 TaxID=2806442 RepID=UPI001BD098AA|nr:cupin domain-containing protein [Rhodococcus sp. USK13]